jgi:hypothetical protein
MITLKADNRSLTINALYSYLNTNYLSGVSSLVIKNSSGFADNDYVLLGEFGSETAEVVQATTVTAATHTLTLGAATKFAHSESTKVTILPYNQVRFYRTVTATFSATAPLAAYTDINADSYYSTIKDATNTTGFGWFVFYNSTTTKASANSNAIPYAGFAENSVKKVLDNFFSDLNNKEQKLISNDEAFSWLNEAYNIAANELNLINREYNVAEPYDISVVVGTQEYALPDTFSRATSVYDETNDVYIDNIDSAGIDFNEYSSNVTYYYIRGSYIGFTPNPTAAFSAHLRYKAKKTKLTSYYDNIEFPNNNYYFLKDYMMFRAGPKLQRQDKPDYYKLFFEAISRMKVNSHKQNASLDAWGIDPTANV